MLPSSNKDLFGCLQVYCSDFQVQFIKFIALNYLLSANKITSSYHTWKDFFGMLEIQLKILTPFIGTV